MRCDVMLWSDVCSRGAKMLQAMIRTAKYVGVDCRITQKGPADAEVLMTWGLGHLARRVYIDRHLKAGGRVIAWDLGYWNRGSKYDQWQSYRVTVDADHPWRLIKPESPERFNQSEIVLREDSNPSGPILLASMGKKSGRLFVDWEAAAVERIKREHPGSRLEIRAKDKDGPPIETALKGKSLVVCRHSNVAIDACIAGVPVECEDGAAYALYRHGSSPTYAQRLQFLQSVAHWQWKQSEGVEAWKFLLAVLSSTSAPAVAALRDTSTAT